MLTSPLSPPQSPGGFGVLKFASVALIRILRTQLLGTPFVERLVPTPALLGEDLNRLADCIFLFAASFFLFRHLNQAEGAVSFVFRYS